MPHAVCLFVSIGINAAFNNLSVISRQSVHLPVLSWLTYTGTRTTSSTPLTAFSLKSEVRDFHQKPNFYKDQKFKCFQVEFFTP